MQRLLCSCAVTNPCVLILVAVFSLQSALRTGSRNNTCMRQMGRPALKKKKKQQQPKIKLKKLSGVSFTCMRMCGTHRLVFVVYVDRMRLCVRWRLSHDSCETVDVNLASLDHPGLKLEVHAAGVCVHVHLETHTHEKHERRKTQTFCTSGVVGMESISSFNIFTASCDSKDSPECKRISHLFKACR